MQEMMSLVKKAISRCAVHIANSVEVVDKLVFIKSNRIEVTTTSWGSIIVAVNQLQKEKRGANQIIPPSCWLLL